MTNGPNRELVGEMCQKNSYFSRENFYLDQGRNRGRSFEQKNSSTFDTFFVYGRFEKYEVVIFCIYCFVITLCPLYICKQNTTASIISYLKKTLLKSVLLYANFNYVYIK